MNVYISMMDFVDIWSQKKKRKMKKVGSSRLWPPLVPEGVEKNALSEQFLPEVCTHHMSTQNVSYCPHFLVPVWSTTHHVTFQPIIILSKKQIIQNQVWAQLLQQFMQYLVARITTDSIAMTSSGATPLDQEHFLKFPV